MIFIDVLLAALSDILAENPALMNKVRNVVGDVRSSWFNLIY